MTLQPELALALRKLVGDIAEHPKPFTGRDVFPVRVAYARCAATPASCSRRATSSRTAAARVRAGMPPPRPSSCELREERGESDAERVEWNLPIAVGSTFKPIVARAAEQAFPHDISGSTSPRRHAAGGCRSRHGAVGPVLGHCPPTSVAGSPTSADLHDFLARSPNWYQIALGLVGLGLPDGRLAAGDAPVSLTEITGSDLASWPTSGAADRLRRGRPDPRQARPLGRRGCGARRCGRASSGCSAARCARSGTARRCERAAARADVCAARALPIAAPGADLRYLVALGPDRIDLLRRRSAGAGDGAGARVLPAPARLRRPRGGLARAARRRVRPRGVRSRGAARSRRRGSRRRRRVRCPTGRAPTAGATRRRCSATTAACAACCAPAAPRTRGAGALLADPTIVVYGAKTGTIDSLADIARRPKACAAWNAAPRPALAARVREGAARRQPVRDRVRRRDAEGHDPDHARRAAPARRHRRRGARLARASCARSRSTCAAPEARPPGGGAHAAAATGSAASFATSIRHSANTPGSSHGSSSRSTSAVASSRRAVRNQPSGSVPSASR